MGVAEIKKDGLLLRRFRELKEVPMNSSCLLNLLILSTNTRFMQLVDGMDNSSPLLNFVLET
jgi:hypothetical protein